MTFTNLQKCGSIYTDDRVICVSDHKKQYFIEGGHFYVRKSINV